MPAITFDLNSIDWELTLIAGRAVFLVFCFALAAFTFTRWRRAADRSTAQFAEQTAQVAQRLAAIDERIEATQVILTELAERVGNSAPGYEIAIRLARGGAAREELMQSCGLTRQEAELVQRLHAPAQHPKIAAVG